LIVKILMHFIHIHVTAQDPHIFNCFDCWNIYACYPHILQKLRIHIYSIVLIVEIFMHEYMWILRSYMNMDKLHQYFNNQINWIYADPELLQDMWIKCINISTIKTIESHIFNCFNSLNIDAFYPHILQELRIRIYSIVLIVEIFMHCIDISCKSSGSTYIQLF
jgi:sugar phosphate isomerase/epimerase